MGNYMVTMGVPNTIYLSDRGNDWSFNTLYCHGPRFKDNRYNPILAQYGVSEAEFKEVLAKADKNGWRRLRPCWLVILLGLLVFGGLLAANIIVGLMPRFENADPSMFICTSYPSYPFNQCNNKSITDKAGEFVCCNFWCCVDDKEAPMDTNDRYYQTPDEPDIEDKLQRYKCMGIPAYRYSGNIDDNLQYEGHAMIKNDPSECRGYIWVEGEYISYPEDIRSKGWPWYYFIGAIIFGLALLCSINSIVFRCVCYKNAVMQVFEDAFLNKGIDVSWQHGGKHYPNFVLLHMNQVPQSAHQHVQPTAVAVVDATVVHGHKVPVHNSQNFPTAVHINDPNGMHSKVSMSAVVPTVTPSL